MTSQVDHFRKANDANTNDVSQLLTFTLKNRFFCLELEKIKEIRAYTQPTELPNSLEFVTGVINIRGMVVPIYDLRKRFGIQEEQSQPTQGQRVVIVINIEGQDIGILVDAVSDIIYENKANIKHSSSAEVAIKGEYIEGIVINNEKVIILLAAQKLFGSDALKAMRNIS